MSRSRRSGTGSLAGLRIAFSPDLDGPIEVEDEVAATRLGGGGELRDPWRRTSNEASPDFTGADECFRILRAWQFEATLGETSRRARRDRPAQPVREHAGRAVN